MKPPTISAQTHGNSEQVQKNLFDVAKVLSSNVSLGGSTSNTDEDKNLDWFKAAGTTPGAANTDFTITHTLGRVPIGFIVASLDQAAIIYKSPTAWTTTTITLRCNVVTVAYFILVF